MWSEVKMLALTWFEDGREDAREIANRLRCDSSATRRFLKRGAIDAKRKERPRTLSEQQVDRLEANGRVAHPAPPARRGSAPSLLSSSAPLSISLIDRTALCIRDFTVPTGIPSSSLISP